MRMDKFYWAECPHCHSNRIHAKVQTLLRCDNGTGYLELPEKGKAEAFDTDEVECYKCDRTFKAINAIKSGYAVELKEGEPCFNCKHGKQVIDDEPEFVVCRKAILEEWPCFFDLSIKQAPFRLLMCAEFDQKEDLS